MKNRHEVISERSNANWSTIAARSEPSRTGLMDINQGCSGYIIGLIQSFLLLDQSAINKVALLNADILSRKVSKKDHNSNPLIGDAASITIVEKSDSDETIHCNIKMDGTRYDALIIPAGGFRQPSTPETAVMEEDIDGNLRSKDNLVMKGDAVFNFMQTEVPPMIEDILQTAGVTKDEIDYYMLSFSNTRFSSPTFLPFMYTVAKSRIPLIFSSPLIG